MTLERKDIRAKLDADVHQALVAICDARGIDIGGFIEALLVPEVKRIVHEASVILGRIPGAGKTGRGGA